MAVPPEDAASPVTGFTGHDGPLFEIDAIEHLCNSDRRTEYWVRKQNAATFLKCDDEVNLRRLCIVLLD